MRLTSFLSIFSIVIALSTSANAAEYVIDGDHSSVGFKERHLAISTVHGRFATVEGRFSYDPTAIANSRAEATIAVSSIDTNQKKRDDHLRSPDFFDASKFPTIIFKSTAIKNPSSAGFTLVGDLTIHGVTRPVELAVQSLGEAKDPWGRERAGFSATATINRKDFGLTWSKTLETGALVVGDEVGITLEVEGIKQ